MFGKTEILELHVEGMTCMHCQKHVTDALEGVKGVKKAEVSLENKKAVVTVQAGKADRDALVKAVEAAGYTAS